MNEQLNQGMSAKEIREEYLQDWYYLGELADEILTYEHFSRGAILADLNSLIARYAKAREGESWADVLFGLLQELEDEGYVSRPIDEQDRAFVDACMTLAAHYANFN